MKQGKVWGETELIFENESVSVHYLKIKKGGFSSKHRHQFKSNMFHVISGSLKLEIWRNKIDHDDTVVVAGESCEIPPLVYHCFKALTDVVAYELYEAKLRGEDIERETVGGLDDWY